MKITIVQGAFLPVPPLMGGGVEKVWFALGQEFARLGHEVVHLSRAYPGLPARETIGGVAHRRSGGYASPRSLALLKALDLPYSLRMRLKLPPADILVTNTFWLPMLVRSPRAGALYVHVARYPKGQLRFYRHAARLQTVSEPIARAIAAQEPSLASKVRMIPNCLPAECRDALQTPPAPPGPSAERRLLYVGRIHPEKGLSVLIDAFGRFVASGATLSAGWRLIIVGPWESAHGGGGTAYHRQLLDQAAPLGSRIEWVGPVFDGAALDSQYRRATLFVYPSLAERGETFGLAPLEAMARGCPPLVSALECFKDFVVEDENGFSFDHRAADPAAELASRLSGIVARGETLRAQVGLRGWETAQDYSPERVASRFLADFASLLPATQSAPCPSR